MVLHRNFAVLFPPFPPILRKVTVADIGVIICAIFQSQADLFAESETHLLLSLRRQYLNNATLEPMWDLAQEIGKMLRQQMDSLAKNPLPPSPDQSADAQRRRRTSFHSLNPNP